MPFDFAFVVAPSQNLSTDVLRSQVKVGLPSTKSVMEAYGGVRLTPLEVTTDSLQSAQSRVSQSARDEKLLEKEKEFLQV